MTDDPDFNINFVALVEKNPCLYDNTRSDYNKKEIQDQAWAAISIAISETVEDCKVRWKNLRAGFSRHIRSYIGNPSSGYKAKKPYYLAEHLHFLQPFSKCRKFRGNISSLQLPKTEQTQEEYNVFHNSDEEPEDTQTAEYMSFNEDCKSSGENKFRSSASKRTRISPKYPNYPEVNGSGMEYFESENISSTEMKTDDPDLAFLKSIIPDMKEMNNEQKRRFKIGILNLAGEILTEF